MNEQQEKAKFRQAIDHTLTGLEGDPFLYQRVTAQTEKGAHVMKHRKWNMGLVIALAVMACIMTAAAASGWFGGYVNWNGEILPEERADMLPHPTAAPEMSVDMSSFRLAQELVMSAQEMEIVQVTQKNVFGGESTTSNRLEKHPDTYEAFLVLLAEAPYLPVPAFIPEGYEFSDCQLVYDCRRDGEYVLTSTEVLEDGSRVERYRVAEEDALLSGYSLSFRRNGDPEDYLAVYTRLYHQTDPAEHHIGVNEDQTAQVMAVAGMDNAIAILSDTHRTLTMRRVLPQKVDYLYYDLEEVRYPDSYSEVQIDVMTRQVDAATMADMFSGQ
ncbi:MAG: hypothetical protein IJZ74_01360 [Clostridia bacterium]|nr:hypothetical protein [Clostridia bacterium]